MGNPQQPEREPTRVALFTVKDAERALRYFLALTMIYILTGFVYEIVTGWNGLLATGWILFLHSPQFLAAATILIISREGGDIVLFRRWTEARRQHAQDVAKAKDEGRNVGFTEGRTEGFTEGRNEGRTEGFTEGRNEGRDEGFTEGRNEGRNEVQQQWRAWNTRRLDAEAKGQPFDEPPPQ